MEIAMIKTGALSVIGALGAVITTLFGGWDTGLATLVLFMTVDYVTGQNSNKTENGALESKAGWKGLCRKGTTLLIVLVACRLDLMLGSNYIRDAVIIGFVLNESISILENVGLMGVDLPPVLVKAIDILKNKTEGDKE